MLIEFLPAQCSKEFVDYYSEWHHVPWEQTRIMRTLRTSDGPASRSSHDETLGI